MSIYNPISEDEAKRLTKIVSDGEELPYTTEPLSYNIADLQASAVRSWYTGVMKLNPIRNDVFSITCTWTDIPLEDMRFILNNTKPKSDGGGYAEIYDPITNSRVTKHMYRSDRKAKIKIYRSGAFADLSFDLIEL